MRKGNWTSLEKAVMWFDESEKKIWSYSTRQRFKRIMWERLFECAISGN